MLAVVGTSKELVAGGDSEVADCGRDAKSQSGTDSLTLNTWLWCANRFNHNGRCSASFAAASEYSDESERCT